MHQRVRPSLRCAGAAAVLLLFAGATAADEFVFKAGRVIGVQVREEGADVVINVYNSKNGRMTFGCERHPKAQLKQIVAAADPVAAYLTRWADHRAQTRDDPDAECALASLALEQKWDDVAEAHFLNALALKPDHAGALVKVDPRALTLAKRADTRLNAELAAAVAKWLATEDAAERKSAHARLAADFGFVPSLVEMERVRRSKAQPLGRRDEVTLSYRSKTDKGVYAIYVPKDYDPLRPWPLVVGLHGGGPDGKDGKSVVGSGKSAMNFYEQGAERDGYIVLCPSAVQAPWSAPLNDSFVLSCMEEVLLLYNVDLNRIYLTGHSMGGFGAWHFGPRYAHLFAAVAPMAGGGHGGVERLIETKTGVYLYHGADDQVVPCQDSRAAAEELRKRRHDFVYTEIPDSGHGFPPDVQEEMWRFFATHRLAVAPNRAEKGKFTTALTAASSFARKVGDEERQYFGAPGQDAPAGDRKSLLARLRLGGGAAAAAGAALAALKDPATIAPLGVLAAGEDVAIDVRVAAIRALGAMQLPDALPALAKAVVGKSLAAMTEAADALRAHGDRAGAKALAKGIARTQESFAARVSSKTAMDYSDFAACLGCLEAQARAAAALGDPVCAPPLVAAVDAILAKTWDVPKSDRAGLDPAQPLAACVLAVLAAFEKLADLRTEAAIRTLASRHAGLAGVADAAAAAAKSVAAGPATKDAR
jgi:poly(3-hydroxybutyrate) depolymerase